MYYLALVSLFWAFSFGLIGNRLAGMDSVQITCLRLLLALLVFLPFFRPRGLRTGDTLRLLLCGSIQFGCMYLCYIQAFRYLPSHLVALFSITTPLYVVIIHELRSLRFQSRHFAAALLSIAGAAVIKIEAGSYEDLWTGFLLMQLSGIAFAFGQVYYRDWKQAHPRIQDARIFALPYAGGCAAAFGYSFFASDWSSFAPSPEQVVVLLYLGVIASGLGFFLWNKGASLSRAGTLAAFNNAVIPIGMFCSLFVFGEWHSITLTDLLRLALGTVLIGVAVWLAERGGRRP
ncbi:EamA family transporter [Coraliomargarita parva]|uniref:EamA family transporter n=1 Tax=Coraliomargarita parva TaxID=3014050 RepID=UPI0022B4EE3C|nr:EamA family transporter [Coraliomargarita parva]